MNITYNQTLYARSSTGKIVKWNIRLIDGCTYPSIDISYGELNGNAQTKRIDVKEGKNIGRANETTPLEQAISEINSKVQKKIKEGYRENIESLTEHRQDASGNNKPMLAKKFESNKMSYPAFAQPKYNGVRAELGIRIVSDGLFGKRKEVYLLSREGNEYPVPEHIRRAYIAFISSDIPALWFKDQGYDIKDLKWDGEIYCHGMALQSIVSAIKKPNDDTSRLYFVCYDVKLDIFQNKRIELIQNIMFSSTDSSFYPISTTKIYSDEEAERQADKYIELGFEGAIIRDYSATYQFGKRSKHLRKIKRTISEEFKLIDIIESGRDNYNYKPIGMFICKNDVNDLTFKVTPQASKEERREYLLNKYKYIGKDITVIFRERTKDKIPFHANGLIRDYE